MMKNAYPTFRESEENATIQNIVNVLRKNKLLEDTMLLASKKDISKEDLNLFIRILNKKKATERKSIQ